MSVFYETLVDRSSRTRRGCRNRVVALATLAMAALVTGSGAPGGRCFTRTTTVSGRTWGLAVRLVGHSRGVQVGFFKSSQDSSQVNDSEILSSQVMIKSSQVRI